jgi:hypothetical protein
MLDRPRRRAARRALCAPTSILALLLALLPALAPPAAGRPAAAPQPATEGWLRATSDHFTLVTDVAEARAREALADLERLRLVLGQLAPDADLDAPVPIRIYLFRDDESFAPFRLRRGAVAIDSPAFLVPHEHGIFGATLAAVSAGPSRYLYKQYVQYLLHRHFPRLPPWFRDGVAEYYATFEVEGSEARIGLPVEEHLLWFKLSRPGSLSVAALVARPDVPANDQPTYFAQAWATFHYLALGNPATRERMPAYLARIAAGAAPEEAFTVFGIGLPELQKALDEYTDQRRFNFFRVPVAAIGAVALEVEPLAAHQVLVELGDLLLHTAPERTAEAAELYRRAAALAPEHAGLAWVGIGEAAELGGDAEAALAAFDKGRALAPDDFLAQFHFGASQLAALGKRRPEGEAELARLAAAHRALGRCTELAPDFAPCWVLRGVAFGLEPRPSYEALPALERARAMLPEREDVALNLLLGYARLGDREAVDNLLGQLEAQRFDPGTLARAGEIRLQMLFQEASLLARRADGLDDAVAVYARVAAETADPGMRERALERVETVGKAAASNRFAERYRQALELMIAGDHQAARELVDQLSDDAYPGGRQAEAVEALRARLGAAADEPAPQAGPVPEVTPPP